MIYTEILDRLKYYYKINDDKDLARILGVSSAVMSNWRTGKNDPDLSRIIKKAIEDQVNLDWLFCVNANSIWPDAESEAVLRAEAAKVQLLIDRGMVRLPALSSVTAFMALPGASVMDGEGGGELDAVEVPHYVHRVAAGLPADSTGPAERIVPPSMLVKHPKDTYAVTVSGDSMTGSGIEEGDVLVVDRAIEPKDKGIVVASINGEQTVKRLKITGEGVSLMPENHKYQEMPITPEMDFLALGVVVWVIRRANG
jgi:SOS-response transcriptional repressor LexA